MFCFLFFRVTNPSTRGDRSFGRFFGVFNHEKTTSSPVIVRFPQDVALFSGGKVFGTHLSKGLVESRLVVGSLLKVVGGLYATTLYGNQKQLKQPLIERSGEKS